MFEITVTRNIFVKALAHTQSVVEKKNIIPIASHLKLEAANNKLTITAVDNTMSISETIDAEVLHHGSIAIPAQTLYDIARKFSEGTILLKIDPTQPNMVEISSGFTLFQLPYLTADNFPKIDVGEFKANFTMPHALMSKIINKNKNTIMQEDIRNNYNGVYLHPVIDDKELRGSATDGHRLSSVRIPMPNGAKNMPAIIIPRKTIFELIKILQDNAHDMEFEVSNQKIRITLGDVIIISKLIESEFPDYLSLIPYHNQLFFSASVAELSKAVDRTTTIVSDKSKAIKFNLSGNQLELVLGGDHQSLANEKLEVQSNSDNFEVNLNSRYVLDALTSIGENATAVFKFSDPFSPILVQAEDDDKTDFIIMGMRT